MRKKGIVFMLVLALAIMAFTPMAMADVLYDVQSNFAPGFTGDVFVANDGSDFLVLEHDVYCELVQNGVIPGEASELYVDDGHVASFGPKGAFYNVKAECFPGFKAVVLNAIEWLK